MIRIKKCPVCKVSKDNYGFNLVSMNNHITKKAKYEVWEKALGNMKTTPHFDYYLKNTYIKPSKTREYKKNNG